MNVRVVSRVESHLPDNDDHPYRTGAWRPSFVEYDADDLDVVGELPRDLDGVYLRNTENPVFPGVGRYHPFDGDGMVHSVQFHGEGSDTNGARGRADYRNRFIHTLGLAAEQAAATSLFAGIIEGPDKSLRDGWGARTRMKDASSTDIVVHGGVALTSFYQCGDLYRLDPKTLERLGTESWRGKFPSAWGVSAHTKVDENTGELLFFSYAKEAPYLRYGVVDASGQLVHEVPVALPGPRLPHDMAFTEHYAILNDFPSFWDPKLLEKGVHRARFHRDMPSRFAILPRRGTPVEIRWFEASPTYVLHFVNAYEDGDEIVLDGFHQGDPLPAPHPGDDLYAAMRRTLDIHAMKTRLHRWRFNLKTGTTKEEFLDDEPTEFGMIHGRFGGRRHRYAYAVTGEPGWFLFNGLVRYDLQTGKKQRYAFPTGVFASESPMAPARGSTDEDAGYLVTFVSDVVNDLSECQVFDARDIERGPIARMRLPERISSGTHTHWAAREALVPPRD